MKPAWTIAVGLTLGAFALAPCARAEEPLEPQLALPILLRVLPYDRAFSTRGEGTFVVLIVAQPGAGGDRDALLRAAEALKVSSIQGRPLRFEAAEAHDVASLREAVRKAHAGAILVPARASNELLMALPVILDTEHTYTLAMDPSAVERKLALLSVSNREGRPQIWLNIESTRAMNASFDSAILRVARLIQ